MTPETVSARMTSNARALRRRATPPEVKLWALLRGRQFETFKFRRQQPIGQFIVDFVCYGRRLVVELDGSQHADGQYDALRDEDLRRRGFRVMRVWNNELTGNPDGVMEAILAALRERMADEPEDV